jgi:hypothetical protein
MNNNKMKKTWINSEKLETNSFFLFFLETNSSFNMDLSKNEMEKFKKKKPKN